VLTFEWILVVTLVVIGLIGGLAAVRNAVLDELYDLSSAVEAMNFSGTGNSPNQVTNNPNAANDASAWWGSAHH
jgi:hypothetical protein